MKKRRKELAVVVSQEQLADGIYSMWIRTVSAADAVPGQFIYHGFGQAASKAHLCPIRPI